MSRQVGLLSRDPDSVRSWLKVLRPWVRIWHRSEVRGLRNVPDGASLIVSNHSGGLFTMDWPVFVVAFAERFGLDRPLYLLSHNIVFETPVGDALRRVGLVPATRDGARTVLDSGAPLMVFPGGDYDVGRPTSKRNVIDFDGRTGYVTTAMEAAVPIVPMVSIGGHENQLYLIHGKRLAKLTGLRKATRTAVLPISFGFPFGPSLMMLAPVNAPLPTKIVTKVLPPVDISAEFGDDADPKVVDAHVRKLMQAALDDLARERRFPVIG